MFSQPGRSWRAHQRQRRRRGGWLKNKKEAIRFLEFLTSAKSQETFGNVNHEYPVIFGNNKSELLKSWDRSKRMT